MTMSLLTARVRLESGVLVQIRRGDAIPGDITSESREQLERVGAIDDDPPSEHPAETHPDDVEGVPSWDDEPEHSPSVSPGEIIVGPGEQALVDEYADLIRVENPNAADTISLAGDDADTARLVILAEQAQTKPRSTVVSELERIASRS